MPRWAISKRDRLCEFCGAPFPELGSYRIKHCSAECRFLSDVSIGAAPGECWLWTGSTTASGGHGQFCFAGEKYSAHRFMLERIEGAVQRYGSALFTLHHCDVPNCVNPRHLYRGTQAENVRDAVSRGRWTQGKSRTRNARGRFA